MINNHLGCGGKFSAFVQPSGDIRNRFQAAIDYCEKDAVAINLGEMPTLNKKKENEKKKKITMREEFRLALLSCKDSGSVFKIKNNLPDIYFKNRAAFDKECPNVLNIKRPDRQMPALIYVSGQSGIGKTTAFNTTFIEPNRQTNKVYEASGKAHLWPRKLSPALEFLQVDECGPAYTTSKRSVMYYEEIKKLTDRIPTTVSVYHGTVTISPWVVYVTANVPKPPTDEDTIKYVEDQWPSFGARFKSIFDVEAAYLALQIVGGKGRSEDAAAILRRGEAPMKHTIFSLQNVSRLAK